MKILVTGGAGFIGSQVVRSAINNGHTVINVDALTYAGNIENVASVLTHSDYHFAQVDIRNRQALDDVFTKYMPDCVMHLAAESHVDKSIVSPERFVQTNINGTLNLLEATRFYWQLKGEPENFRFLHVSTDEVFGSLPDDINVRFTEKTPYDPRSPYASSKAGSDHLVKAWHTTYGMPILLTNCSNNYGQFHFPEKLIPLVIINALTGKKIPIYGNGKNIRDWLYVEDHVSALFLVLEKGVPGRSYNIGGDNEVTNIELVGKLCTILDTLKPTQDKYSKLITFVEDRPGHDERYGIDPTRICAELGWRPETSLELGLRKTVEWYLDNEEWWRPLMNAC